MIYTGTVSAYYIYRYLRILVIYFSFQISAQDGMPRAFRRFERLYHRQDMAEVRCYCSCSEQHENSKDRTQLLLLRSVCILSVPFCFSANAYTYNIVTSVYKSVPINLLAASLCSVFVCIYIYTHTHTGDVGLHKVK